MTQSSVFIVHTHAVKLLRNGGCRFVRSCDFDRDGVLQIASRQTLDFGRESRREQKRRSLLRQMTQDALQVWQEADVQHPIGLIEHHIFHLVKHHIFSFNVIEQTSGRRH